MCYIQQVFKILLIDNLLKEIIIVKFKYKIYK